MKKFWYIIAGFAVLWYVGSSFGVLTATGLLLVILIMLIWKRRASILTNLASQAYYVKGNVEKGEKLFQTAYKTGLMTPECKIAYSSFCLRENRFDKGKRLLNEVINSKRSSTKDKISAKHNLAILVWKEGDLEEALRIMEIVHKELPATNTYGSLGVLYLEKVKQDKNYDEVLPFMLEAYEYNDADKTIADNLGELYLIMGEYEKSKEVYEKLLEKELITPMPYYNYGIVLKNLGDKEGAEKNFEKALTCRFTTVLTVTREMIQQELDSLS